VIRAPTSWKEIFIGAIKSVMSDWNGQVS